MRQSSLISWFNRTARSQHTLNEEDTSSPVISQVAAVNLSRPLSTKVHGQDGPTSTTETNDLNDKSSSSNLPTNAEFRKCERQDIPAFKRLNSLLLPIPYPESFYREIIEDSLTSRITLLAFWHDDPNTIAQKKGKLIGAIRCRILAHSATSSRSRSSSQDGPMLYLSTLVLLSPFRGHGVATRLVDTITERAVTEHGVTTVGAHVWSENAIGLEWYRKRGFKEVGREEGYYRRLEPQTAVVMQKDLRVTADDPVKLG